MSRVARALTVCLALWVMFMSLRTWWAYNRYVSMLESQGPGDSLTATAWSDVQLEIGFMIALPVVIVTAYAILRWILSGSE